MDRRALQERYGIVGKSPALMQLLDRVRQVAPADITVLIEGESGVGKELIAQAIHGLSSRRHRALVVVNCGAIPEGLIESELFGHEKGSYTGATDRRAGHFEEANFGTIFLDEIGEMPLAAQVKLLRVLESGQFTKVGSSKLQQVDVRVIAATNKDLGEEVRTGRFREDLYYRLGTVILQVPPLRNRKEDILPIFESMLFKYAQQYNAPMKRLSEDAIMLLRQYPWPGNVRELRNVAEQAVVLSKTQQITASDIRPFLRGVTASNQGGLTLIGNQQRGGNGELEFLYRALLDLKFEVRDLKNAIHALVTGKVPHKTSIHGTGFEADENAYPIYPNTSEPFKAPPLLPEPWEQPESYEDTIEDAVSYALDESLPEEEKILFSDLDLPTMQEAENALIQEGLKRFEGNRRKTAQHLGISERTLYRKIKEFELLEDDTDA